MESFTRKQRILIVDDVPENIRMLGEVLREAYRISFATEGAKALELAIAAKDGFDLILLDIMMPEMDGYEVCQALKRHPKTMNIPVIFITAKTEEADETKGLQMGAVDYITKPFSKAIVKARVQTHLELKRHRDFLEHLSSLDGLTGIPNRRRFDECMGNEWRGAIRENTSISLIMIDIDYFGAYNNTYNHVAGDDCLKKVARTLAASVKRPSDFVARYGGEEFAAILPKTDMQGALHIAERMRKNIESLDIPHSASPVDSRVTISLGVSAVCPTGVMTSDILIQGSDSALFDAKRSGRNRVKSVTF